jgi:hypothetical protein
MDPKNDISKITCKKSATPMAFRNSKTYDTIKNHLQGCNALFPGKERTFLNYG